MVWSAFHDRLHQTLRQRRLLEKGQRILIAVSGGQDSLCLARLLLDLQSRWSWELAIAHCDHGWRPDSSANADHVVQLATTWGIPCYRRTAQQTLTSEAAARAWRYDSLADIAQEQGYTCLVTGHTASDRAETLLYNLVRGSGSDGLQALQWRRQLAENLMLVRPLLEFTRQETAQVCQELSLPVWEDGTNQDWAYARNRIRQELLPYLQRHLNAQAEHHLAQTAEILAAEVAYLEQAGQSLYEQALVEGRLNRAILRTVPLALQRRVIRRFLQTALPQAPNFDQVEQLVKLVNAPNRSRTAPFPGGAIAEVRDGWIDLQWPEGDF